MVVTSERAGAVSSVLCPGDNRSVRIPSLPGRVLVLAVAMGGAAAMTSCSSSGGHVVVPKSAANAYPADASAALCSVGLHPRYLRVPTLVRADINVNGYAVKSLNPGPGTHVPAGTVVDVTLNEDVNGGRGWSGPPGRRSQLSWAWTSTRH